MGRTKKVITEETIPINGPDDNGPDELDEWLSGMESGHGTVKLYRIASNNRHKWLANYDSVQGLTEESLLETFGSGRFLIRVRKATGKGWLPSKVFEIEGPPQPIAYAPPVSDNNNGHMERIFLMMQESQQRTHELLVAMISNKGNGTTPTTVTDLVSGLAGLKALEPKSGGDELDKVSKILEIAERFSGNGGAPKDTATVLLEMAKDVVPALLAARALPPPALAPGSGHHEVTPAEHVMDKPNLETAPTVKASETGAGSDPLKVKVKEFWQKLGVAAEQNEDAEGFAGMLLDMAELLHDEVANVVVVSIERSRDFDAWKSLVGITPINEAWFAKLFQAVKSSLAEGPNEMSHPS